MAPLCNILVQLLSSLPSRPNLPIDSQSIGNRPSFNEANQQQQQPIPLTPTSDGMGEEENRVSAVSWSENRLDIFSLTANNLTHKFWDGHQWNPSGKELETLGNGLATPPVAVTWGVDRLDVFGLDDHNVIKHQYWDGSSWRPDVAEFENLGGECDPLHPISASSWGKDRLDIFCTGPEGDLLHQYYDGSQWQPSAGSLESLGGSLLTGPSVVSWGKNRLDIFGVDPAGDVSHLYWDGSQWSEWEALPFTLNFHEPLTVTSWGENRLDVYGVSLVPLALWHKYWDGSQWSAWENLGDEDLLGSVAATSWAPGRHDIVARRANDSTYLYKYYDGQSWRPDTLGWYNKGPDYHFDSNPSVVSWGNNRLDIFGVNYDDELLHQAWTAESWYPSNTDWETLGSGLAVVDGNVRVPDGLRPAETELRK